MSFWTCLSAKIKAKKIPGAKGKAAQERWKKIADEMIAQGEPPLKAYAEAADVVVKELQDRAARQEHRLLARAVVIKGIEDRVGSAKNLKTVATSMVDDLDFDARAIHRSANGQLGDFLQMHAPDITGKMPKPMEFMEFLKALHGEATGDATAQAFAKSMNDLHEWFRVKFNQYGYWIDKRTDWGLPHSHDAWAIWKAGYGQWKQDIAPSLNWKAMTDPRTGKAFTKVPDPVYQDEFLRGAYENIIYGRQSKDPQWGGGMGHGNPLERARVFKFTNADGWVRYNQKYGAADPFNALMQNIDHMARQVAMARKFGPDPEIAADYLEQVLMSKARNGDLGKIELEKIKGNARLAKNMVRFMSGGVGPNGYFGAVSAKFFSTTRKLIQSALLDRAVIISVPSDMNSARMAAQAIEMNPANMLSTYVGLMQDSLKGGGMTRDDLLRQGHIADSFANPSSTSDRFNTEFPAAKWAHVLSNAAMQVQGLMAHTDNLKMAFQKSFAGHFASMRGKAWADLPAKLRNDMATRGGITADDWNGFRLSGGEFTAQNGAVFLDPLYWRNASSLPDAERDALFWKFQAYVEKWTELAVPSQSLIAKGLMDPSSYGMAPGSVFYEVAKSAGMFKSFVGAFVMNQVRMLNMKQGRLAKAAYLSELIGTTTLVGALGIQINELLMGRDPRPMAEDSFLWQAMLRGGGLGPVGDILAQGSTSWGSGLPGYVAGPIPQFAQDVSKLTFGNVAQAYFQAMDGKEIDTKFLQEFAKFQSRYTPLWQSPVAAGGAAFDRLITDQLLMLLDPDAAKALATAAKRRANLYGNQAFWPPGAPIPQRAPDLGNAFSR